MRLLLFFSFLFLIQPSFSQQYYMLVGTYNSVSSEGIYVYKFNSDSGTASLISMIKASNPSYLAVSPDNNYVYAVGETAGTKGRQGTVSSFSFNKKTGSLKLLSTQSSGGDNPCYITTTQNGKWAIVANYSSGDLSVLRIKKGKLNPAVQTIRHTGSGPDTNRQKTPHVHGVFTNTKSRYIYFTDLGIDKVMAYSQNKAGLLNHSSSNTISMLPGSGPRHLDFHPNGKYMYVLNELSNSVSILKDTGSNHYTEIQNLSTLPLYFKGKSTAADIHVSPDGKFLYSSNRGTSNTIAVFSIDPQTGTLTAIGHTYTEGETPRNFNFDPSGNYLITGNQNSNTIVVFKRNKETGLLSDTGQRISVGKPVCIKWIPAQ